MYLQVSVHLTLYYVISDDLRTRSEVQGSYTSPKSENLRQQETKLEHMVSKRFLFALRMFDVRHDGRWKEPQAMLLQKVTVLLGFSPP